MVKGSTATVRAVEGRSPTPDDRPSVESTRLSCLNRGRGQAQAEVVTSEVAAIDQAMARVEANRNKPDEGARVVSISQNDPLAESDKEERTRKAARARKPKIESSPDLKVDAQMRDDPTITFSTKLHLTVAQELNRLYHERATLGLHPYRKMDLVEEGLRMVFDKYLGRKTCR